MRLCRGSSVHVLQRIVSWFALWGFLASAPGALAQFRVQFGVRIPMRDGVQLAADMWLPKEPGRYPAILVRTPYLKTLSLLGTTQLAQTYASHGYVTVIQDVRGRGDSDGEFGFFFQEGHDGYDTIEWMAAQPWSNGKIGMMGVSYLGTVQWLAAREHPPHLTCIAPTAPAGRYFDEIPYTGGAWGMWWGINWLNSIQGRIVQSANSVGIDMKEVYEHRPVATMDEAFGRPHMRFFHEFLEHDTVDAYWKRIMFSKEDFEKLDIPSLTVSGWFDGDQPGALFYWRNMRAHSPAKNKQYLLIGPWNHNQTFLGGAAKQGGFEFSADSVYDIKALRLAFFDHFLKGTPAFDFPRAKIYVMGSNKWRDEQEYTPAAARTRSLYFHSQGKANTLDGDGRLSWDAPKDETPDHYTYVPENPVVPADNEDYGADQRYMERREDVLVYTSDKLKDPVEVIGEILVHLSASSDARDTDFTARLLDVYPDGKALVLGPQMVGIIRARYRKAYDHTELLTPNKTEQYQIDLNDIGYTFLSGHQIRVEISSSYAPTFLPNSNTGNPVATDTESRPAKQTILHEGAWPSYISLPVMPNP